MVTNTASCIYQSQKEVTAKYMDFNSCVQEMKTTHADVKYHCSHQIVDHTKTLTMSATRFDHNQDITYGRAQVHKSALFDEDRDYRYNEIEPLVLPTQLPSDSDESDEEVGNINTMCLQENRAPLMTINSVLQNEQKVRIGFFNNYFHLFLIKSSAIIIFVSQIYIMSNTPCLIWLLLCTPIDI